MPITWIEDTSSRSATIYRLGRRDVSTRQRVFHVVGTSNEDTLHAACNTAISTTYPYWTFPGQPQVKLRAESYSVEYQGDTAWRVTINYEKGGADDLTQSGPLKRARSFDTTGGQQHISNALKTGANDTGERRYGLTGLNDCADMKGSIGVDENSVQGVDIVVPSLSWTEQYDVPSSYVTTAYIRQLAILSGCTNDAAFRGFAAGEVLFLGAQGGHDWDAQRGDGPWSLSYKFVAEPNRGATATMPALNVGDITGIEKKGHEYLWVAYASGEDAAKAQITKTPIAVYVDRVYHEGDFSKLGIGIA